MEGIYALATMSICGVTVEGSHADFIPTAEALTCVRRDCWVSTVLTVVM